MAGTTGTLCVVGTGIESMGQMTLAARGEIKNADKVFYLTADPLTERHLRSLSRSAESLHHLYETGRHRVKTYAAMVERVLEEVRKGKRVCYVLYGHPGVFAMPAHVAIRVARQEGYRAYMLPGISADACLIADLGIDPAKHGWQSYEATAFLVRGRRADPTAGLLLWQIGVLGRFDYPGQAPDRSKLEVMSEVLLRWYPATHKGVLYEASPLPGYGPSLVECELGSLHEAEMSPVTTLYVPPAQRPQLDEAMMKRLGITTEMHLQCLKE
jgi:precorrin-6B methylase 1